MLFRSQKISKYFKKIRRERYEFVTKTKDPNFDPDPRVSMLFEPEYVDNAGTRVSGEIAGRSSDLK